MECAFCRKSINTKEEKYAHVEDWDKEKMIKDIWCHVGCFNRAMNRDLTALEKQAREMLEQAKPLLNMLPKSAEVYEI